jgi:hypothetical protein
MVKLNQLPSRIKDRSVAQALPKFDIERAIQFFDPTKARHDQAMSPFWFAMR